MGEGGRQPTLFFNLARHGMGTDGRGSGIGGQGSRASVCGGGASGLALEDDGRAWHTLTSVPHGLFLRQANICADYYAEWRATPVSDQGEQAKKRGAKDKSRISADRSMNKVALCTCCTHSSSCRAAWAKGA